MSVRSLLFWYASKIVLSWDKMYQDNSAYEETNLNDIYMTKAQKPNGCCFPLRHYSKNMTGTITTN